MFLFSQAPFHLHQQEALNSLNSILELKKKNLHIFFLLIKLRLETNEPSHRSGAQEEPELIGCVDCC